MIALAGVVKLAYVLEYFRMPFLDGALGDSGVYLHQARSILDGDFGDPSLLAMSPLYGWMLAILGGPVDPRLAVAVQLGLGLFNLWLIYRIVHPRFGEAAGIASMLLYAGYGLFLFYETKLLSETLGLTLALLALTYYLGDRSQWRAGVACGALLGLAVLARASLVFSLPLFVLFAMPRWERSQVESDTTKRLKWAGSIAAGIAVVLVARGLWTLLHAGVFVPVLYASPETSIVGRATQVEWSGNLGDVAHDPSAPLPSPWDVVRSVEADLARSEQDPQARPSLWATLGAIDLGGWMRGAPEKLGRSFSDVETSFQYGYYGERTVSHMLDALPISFHILVLLGLIGGAFLAREKGLHALLPYVPLVLGCLLTTTLFHPSSRYRLPMVLPFVLLGGYGVVALVEQARRKLALKFVAVGVGAACVFSAYRTVAYELKNPVRWELTQAEAWAAQGRRREMMPHLERAHELRPQDPDVQRRIRYVLALSGTERPE